MKNDASLVVIASFDAEKAFQWIEWQFLFTMMEILKFAVNALHQLHCSEQGCILMSQYYLNFDFRGRLVKGGHFQCYFCKQKQTNL